MGLIVSGKFWLGDIMRISVLTAMLTLGLMAAGAASAQQQPAPLDPIQTPGRQAPPPPPAPRLVNSSDQIVVPFSNPSRPGTVHVSVLTGSVTITAGTGRDVVINASGRRVDSRGQRRERTRDAARSDGLRRLDQPFGLDVREEGNVVTVSAGLQDQGALSIVVPARTNLQVNVVNGGRVTIDGIEGEIDANNVNGAVTLTNVSGAAVAHSVNGDVHVTLRQLVNAPMAFTSMNGEVDVTLPASAKANLRLRSDHGEIYTDFDVQPTPVERGSVAIGSSSSSAGRPQGGRNEREARDKSVRRFEIDRSIYGTINGGGAELELRTFNGDVYLRKAK
jgi:hypothetical protein